MKSVSRFFAILGPGVLVAATGVGAGDLATGAFTGSQLGLTILWAVVIGAVFKFALNEGLARWQLATGTTILEGCSQHFGIVFLWSFLAYLILWTFFVAAALMSASGVVLHAICPVFQTAFHDKILWGIVQSLVAVTLVFLGGYRLFERVMAVCIAIMFFIVVTTAVLIKPDLSEVFSGLFIPRIPQLDGAGLDWSVALLGGIGGTLTIVCYGYWIREENRTSLEQLNLCRLDLATGYIMTALFGIAMVIIGSQTDLEKGSSSQIILLLAEQLKTTFGEQGHIAFWLFLLGAWGAVFSSLLGVWQSIPYLFTDVFESLVAHYKKQTPRQITTSSTPYRCYLVGMATVPMVALWYDFKTLQKIYSICGALIIPMLAMVLLILGSQQKRIGQSARNPFWSTAILSLALLFFLYAGFLTIQKQLN